MMKTKINMFQGLIELYCNKNKHIRYLVDYAFHETIFNKATIDCREEISIEITYLTGTAPDDIKAHLSWVSCLQFNLDAVQLSLESILRAGVKHLASHSRGIRRPCDEKDLALLAVLFSHKIKVVDSISALISGKCSSEVLIAGNGLTNLLNNHLLQLLINLVNYEAVCPLRLQIQKLQLAFIIHSHS